MVLKGCNSTMNVLSAIMPIMYFYPVITPFSVNYTRGDLDLSSATVY